MEEQQDYETRIDEVMIYFLAGLTLNFSLKVTSEFFDFTLIESARSFYPLIVFPYFLFSKFKAIYKAFLKMISLLNLPT